MDVIRVLYIAHGSARGGAQLSLLYMLQALDTERFETIVCSSEDDPEVIGLFSRHGIRTCSCSISGFSHTTGGSLSLTTLRGWKRLCKGCLDYGSSRRRLESIIREVMPDLVHFNSLTLAPYACVPFRMGIPAIVHVRESVLEEVFGLMKRWLRAHLNRFADKIVCVCRDNMDRLGLGPAKAEVLYNPVDFRKFDWRIDQSTVRRELGIPPASKVVLFASGSTPEVKGLYPFLDAMGRILELEPNLVCLMPSFSFPPDPDQRIWNMKRRIGRVVGIYKKPDLLFSLLKKNNLGEHIISSPFIYDIERWIAACDIVCVLHIGPHFSRTVMEAGSMKKPVIAFRIGGVEEIVRHGETGILLPVGDIPGLADTILRMFEDDPLRHRLGEGGFEQALRLFDACKGADHMACIYQSLVGKNTGRSDPSEGVLST